MKSQRKAPTPEQEVRKCDGKRSEEMRMDIIGSIRKPIRSAGDESKVWLCRGGYSGKRALRHGRFPKPQIQSGIILPELSRNKKCYHVSPRRGDAQ